MDNNAPTTLIPNHIPAMPNYKHDP